MRVLRPLAVAVVLGTALLAAPAKAQVPDSRSEVQVWGALLGNGALEPEAPGLRFWLDLHARRGEQGSVFILRPGIGYDVLEWLTLWAGYAYVPVTDDEALTTTGEHRIWQQATISLRASDLGLAFQSRTRFEQRFSEVGSDVGFRLRQFVRLNWQPSPAVPIGIALWDELFVGLNDTGWGAPGGVDQNRIFIGPFLSMAPWARFEVGYLFVYLDRPTNVFAHVIALNLFYSLRPSAEPPE